MLYQNYLQILDYSITCIAWTDIFIWAARIIEKLLYNKNIC